MVGEVGMRTKGGVHVDGGSAIRQAKVIGNSDCDGDNDQSDFEEPHTRN